MKKLIYSTGVFIAIQFLALTIFHQHSYSQQFYFPKNLYNDSMALSKALLGLAQQVLPVYYASNKSPKDLEKESFYDSAFQYEMAALNYKRSIDLLDSSRKYADAGFTQKNIEFESYANAKSDSQSDNASFNKAYMQALDRLYKDLSFNKKLSMEFTFDTGYVKYSKKSYDKIAAELTDKNTDTISYKDAKELLSSYNAYLVYRTVMPLAMQYINKLSLRVMHPVIKDKWSGVLPVNDIDEFPDTSLQYNLLMEMTSGIKNKKDSNTIENSNGAFSEAGRLLNLHVAAGVPKKNIHIVTVVHASALYFLLNNDAYKKKYGVNNPNLPILKELQNAGVKFIACGQAMHFFNVEKEDMIPGIKIALTAQTVLSTYKLKNYAYYDLSER